MGKRLGLGSLNFVIVLLLIFGAQALIHGHVGERVGISLLSGIVLGAYLVGSHTIERRPPPELADFGGIGEIATGVALGVGLFSVVMGFLWVMGVYHPSGRGASAGLGSGLLFALVTGILEETLVRGFLFRLIQIAAGTWIAVGVSAATFGFLHAFNPGATLMSSISIALEAGVLLAAAYAMTGRLWFPIGLHAGWNFTEGSVFGMSVSGGHVGSGLIAGALTGPNLLTGGEFGPEASLVAVIVCLILAALLLWRTVRSGRVEAPPWKSAIRRNS